MRSPEFGLRLMVNRGGRDGAKVYEGLRESFGFRAGCAVFPERTFASRHFRRPTFLQDLKKIDVPTLILHGDDDQIVTIGASALLSSKLVKNAQLKIYKGAPHGMWSTLKIRLTRSCSSSAL
jgi:non-heme chloroperoxidase